MDKDLPDGELRGAKGEAPGRIASQNGKNVSNNEETNGTKTAAPPTETSGGGQQATVGADNGLVDAQIFGKAATVRPPHGARPGGHSGGKAKRADGQGDRKLDGKLDSKMHEVRELIEHAKKRGRLSYSDMMDALEAVDLTPEQIEAVYKQLADLGIEVEGHEDGADGEDDDGEEAVEGTGTPRSGPGGDDTDAVADPVRAALRE